MAYDVSDRQDYLRTRMRAINQNPITYQRKGQPDITGIVATCYELKTEELVLFGVALDKQCRDYILELQSISGFNLPEPGDTIRDNKTNLICVVCAFGSEPHFKYTSGARLAVRVHTTVIGFHRNLLPV